MQPSGTSCGSCVKSFYIIVFLHALRRSYSLNFVLTMSFARTNQSIARKPLNSLLRYLKYVFVQCVYATAQGNAEPLSLQPSKEKKTKYLHPAYPGKDALKPGDLDRVAALQGRECSGGVFCVSGLDLERC